MIALRKAHLVLRRRTFFKPAAAGGPPEILWHGVQPARPDFSAGSCALAFALDGRGSDHPGIIDCDLYVAMNSGEMALDFRIPASPSGRPWRRVVDTATPSPEDFLEVDLAPRVPVSHIYSVQEHSMIILVSEPGKPMT